MEKSILKVGFCTVVMLLLGVSKVSHATESEPGCDWVLTSSALVSDAEQLQIWIPEWYSNECTSIEDDLKALYGDAFCNVVVSDNPGETADPGLYYGICACYRCISP